MKNVFLILFLSLSLLVAQGQSTQSSGVFCTDLNQLIHFAAGKFESVRGKPISLVAGSTMKQWESTLILAGTLSGKIQEGPDAKTWHYVSTLNTGNDIKSAEMFRDNLAQMSKACLDGTGYKATETRTEATTKSPAIIEQTFINYDFQASRQMKIKVFIKNADPYQVVFDLSFTELTGLDD